MNEQDLPDQGDEIGEFEIELEDTFSQVHPDPVFVQRLRQRLTSSPDTVMEGQNQFFNLFLAFSIVAGGLFFVVLLARLVYRVLKALHILH